MVSTHDSTRSLGWRQKIAFGARPSALFKVLTQAPVGATITIGSGLLFRPESTGRILALPSGRRAARGIGVADLLLATVMVTCRPRWPAMAARAFSNLLLGWLYFSRAENTDQPRRARRMGVVMAILAAVDSATAVAMRRRE